MKKVFTVIIFSLSALLILSASDTKTDVVNALVKKLGDGSYKVRKQARNELKLLLQKEPDLFDALDTYKNHRDPELRMSVKELLKRRLAVLAKIDISRLADIESRPSAKIVKLTFKNQSAEEVKVFWIDFAGQQQRWRQVIAPGESEICEKTFESHVWLIKGKNNQLPGLYRVGDEDCQMIIRKEK